MLVKDLRREREEMKTEIASLREEMEELKELYLLDEEESESEAFSEMVAALMPGRGFMHPYIMQ